MGLGGLRRGENLHTGGQFYAASGKPFDGIAWWNLLVHCLYRPLVMRNHQVGQMQRISQACPAKVRCA